MIFSKEIAFQETAIGNIPREWECVSIGQISDIHRGASPRPIGSPEYFADKGRGWVRISDVTETYKYLRRTYQYLSELGESKSVRVDHGDLIMSICATIGKPIIVDMKACIHDGFVVFGNLSSRVNSEFLFYILQQYKQTFSSMRQTGTQGNLNTGLVKRTQIPLPSLGEQQGIVEVLSLVDSAIQKTDEVIFKVARLKKGLMQQLLTHGIGHVDYKDIPTEKIPATWKMKKLEEVSNEVIIGNVNPATPFYTAAENGVPYFRSQNVRENNLVPTDTYVKKEFNQIHPKSVLRENDVLTIQTGFIGTSCLVPKIDEGSNCHSLLITRTNPQLLSPQFLCHFLNSDAGKKTIMKHNAGWGRNHLLLEDFRKAYIPIPPLAEQEKIANIISATYQKAALEKTEKLKLERIKMGLMDLLLTGEVRIKVD